MMSREKATRKTTERRYYIYGLWKVEVCLAWVKTFTLEELEFC